MKILIMKFRVNDLDPSIGKQIEFSNKIVQDFFEFKKDKEYVDFIYNDYAFKPFYNKKVIHVYLSLSPARGDYKVYQNEDNSLFLKNFFIQNLGLSPEKNKNDYFTLTKLSSTQYTLSYIPCESDLGKLIIGNQLKSGDVVEAIEDNEKPQKRTRINRLRKKLEEYAIANNLLVSVDSYGDRVVLQNGCVIDVSKNTLFTCIHNDRFDLFKTSINKALEEKKYWHICTATEVFPQEPYAASKISEILDGSDDKCLYTEIADDSEFETFLGELIEILSKQIIIFKHEPFIPSQKIYYGVPGCGKSHTITTMLKDEKVKDPTFSEENQVVRTTFHPEYTNADFIGQILPEVHEDSQGKSVVEYKFKPGPFAKILKQALHNPSRPFYLVIEEINRGNAAAIFGDVFQLLDRLKNGDTSKEPVGTDGFENHYGKGWSEYFVMNADVNAYIRDAKSDDELDTKSIDVSGIHFSSSTGLRLPPNLSIYATMNTSDQNVFTLDNAFQRRWDMELVPNICKWNDEDHKKQAKLPIGDTDIRWETFRNAINSEISDGDFFNADDKQLGLFFIEAEGDKIDGKKFANKVLKYLWADVFKRDTGKIFKSENLSKVVEDFTGTDAFDKVFVEDFVKSLNDANDEIKNHE